jgi:hypothetical protein
MPAIDVGSRRRQARPAGGQEEGGGNAAYMRAGLGGRDQMARTPESLMRMVRALFVARAFYDPCPEHRPLGFDGLTSPWRRLNYVNPPYNDVASWMAKAAAEARQHGRTSVLLVPARPYTRYFADVAFPEATRLLFLQQRVAFRGYRYPLPAPLMLAVFGTLPTRELPAGTSRELPARLLDLSVVDKGSDVPPLARLLHMLRQLYGPFDHEAPASESPVTSGWGRRNMVCVTRNIASHAVALGAFHAARPDATTVCVLQVVTHTRYFCEHLMPYAREVVFVVPYLGGLRSTAATGGRSTSGSMVVLLGRRIPGLPRAPRTVAFVRATVGCDDTVLQ